ncbi:CIR protein [Plasmodium chabaudi chabaudi]|uniref:CIR protein n=1 Tax=Plasmodium chabaudi chabaudi TaxID=31271 RepID=A0A1D3L7J6_PLACU|nr:CIR protein [Plasmodium chabaudi chabaudi]
MSKKLCEIVNLIDSEIIVNVNNSNVRIKNDTKINHYCPTSLKEEECNKNILIVNSAIIELLKIIKDFVNEDALESGKLTQYTILWLCYKLNLMSYEGISNINDFHNKYIKDKESDIQKIVDVEAYNIYKDLINKKGDLVNMDIKIMSKFYETLKFLCKLYTGCNEKETNYANYLQDANDFVKEFQKLNENRSITGNESYSQILSSLFNDYNNFKNDCAKNCSKCSDIAPLPDIILPPSSGVTSPSSSIEKTLIPVLLAFSIAFFLGIAYKYSLFGFDKQLKRIHSREKLKKIKEKMNRYI